jgi:hypothetical protein
MRVRSNEITHYTTRGGESKQAPIVIAKNSTLVTKLHYFGNYYSLTVGRPADVKVPCYELEILRRPKELPP